MFMAILGHDQHKMSRVVAICGNACPDLVFLR